MNSTQSLSKKGEPINTSSAQLNQTGNLNLNTANNSSTLKGKLQLLEEQIQLIADEMNNHKNDVIRLKTEKDNLQETLKNKTGSVKTNLLQDLYKVEDEMKRHFSHQTSENGRLQQKITSLKAEKTALQNQLIALQRRISDLEMQVGNDDIKF